MENEEFEKLSDHDKLSFYDSEIKKASEDLDNAYTPNLFILPGGYDEKRKEQNARRLESKLAGLRNDRQSFLDRMRLGLSNINVKKNSRQIFIAAWFDSSRNESIEAISKGINDAGFEPECIKDEHFSERIMDKALGEIRLSRCIIVDLTGQRASVFFEAGFAYGLEIQIIYVYKKSAEKEISSLEFYVKHFKCYGYENPTDLQEMIREILLARLSQ